MLGDGVCQLQCLTSACSYDKGDCDASICGAGCYPDMQGDGLCQPECHTPACLWDYSDCDCSPGCAISMIGDGVCDEACYTAQCEWDIKDCECAKGCRYSDLGKCKAECLVPLCNYDSWTWLSSPCVPPSGFGCAQNCEYLSVVLLKCSVTLTCCALNANIQLSYCEKKKNYPVFPIGNRDLPDRTSKLQPAVYYVYPGEISAGTGSSTDPFLSISYALNQAHFQYVDLLLAPGEYLFPGYSALTVCNPPINFPTAFYPIKQLRFLSQDCTPYTPNCLRPVLIRDDIIKCYVNLPTAMTIEFINIVSKCKSTVRYCYNTWILANPGTTVSLVNVTLPELGILGIMLLEAKLYLTNMDLEETAHDWRQYGDFPGTISSNTTAEVIYRGGSVSRLNKYCYHENYPCYPFINLKRGKVLIEGIHFRYNTGTALIQVGNGMKCLISNCLFELNLATIIYYNASSLPGYSWDREEAQTIASSSLDIVDCVFRNNTGRKLGSILVQFGSVLQRVFIRNCSFTNEYSDTYGIVSITSSGYSPFARTDFWKYVDGSHRHKVSFPAISIAIQDSQFINCTVGSFGLLHLVKLPHVLLSNVTFRGHGDFGNVNVFTNTFNALPNQTTWTYPVYLAIVPLSSCLSIINMTDIEDLVVTGLNYEHFTCSQGIYLSNCKNGSLADLKLQRNEGFNETGAVLFLNFTEKLTIRDSYYHYNRNSHSLGKGTVAVLGNSLTVHVYSSSFEGNWANYGSALYLFSAGSISVSDSSFINNSASTGGAICLELPSWQSIDLTLIGLEFRGNSVVSFGGAVAVLSTASVNRNFTVGQFYSDKVMLANISFDSNLAKDGAAISLDCRPTNLQCSLNCSNVTLLHNTATNIVNVQFDRLKYFNATRLFFYENEGICLELERVSGYCEYCKFRGNRAAAGSAFYLTNSTVSFKHSQFNNNSAETYGGVGFMKSSAKLVCDFCLFFNNSAGLLGGVLYMHSSFLLLSSSNFSYNSARNGGFALQMYHCFAPSFINTTTITYNSGRGTGVVSLLFSTLSLGFSVLQDNSGLLLTGGIHAFSSHFNAYHCDFNRQTGYSGVFLHLSQSSSAYIEASSFSNGTALSSGGAATVLASAIQFERCQFRALSGRLGAALSLQNNAHVEIQRSEFQEINVTDIDRGVINGYKSTVRVISSLFAQFTQSAVSGESMHGLEIVDCRFRNAVGRKGGAVLCTDCVQAYIADSLFRTLEAETGGALYLTGNSTSQNASWTVSNCTFDSCFASEGGAVYAAAWSVVISHCSFLNNSAVGDNGRGGAVLLVAQSPVKSEISSCDFSRNRARLEGGSIYWQGTQFPPSLQDNEYQGNTAQYGNDFASYITDLKLRSAPILTNVASGQVANVSIELDLVDHYGQVVTIEKSSYAQINSSNVAGTTRIQVLNGQFTFAKYIVIAPPGTNTTLTISTTALAVLATLQVQMRNCTVGEALTNGQCIPCAPNSYNLEAGVTCQNCPEEAQCLGNFTLVPKRGYWRASDTTDKFFACPHAEACKGYPEVLNLTGECQEGYEGNKCETCSKGYFRWSRIRCSKCPSSFLHSMGELGLWAAILLFLVLLIKLSLKPASLNSTPVKILLNYLQLVMLFDSFHLAWPELMLNLFNAQEAVGGFPEYLFSFGCLYEDESELQTYYRKLIVLSFILPLLVFVSCCVWLGLALCMKSISPIRNEMIASGIILFFAAQPSVMRVLLGVLHCEEILPGEYWVVGVNLRCWQASHLPYALALALPCLLLWGIAIPAIVFIHLSRQRNHSDQLNYGIRYGFLIAGYKNERFYWEYVILYRKLLIIAFIVFFSQISLFLQVLSTLGLLLSSITLQTVLKPYSQSAHNTLETRSLVVTTLTLYSGLFFYTGSLGTVGKQLLFSVISLLNATFSILCLAQVVLIGAKALVRRMRKK